MIAIAAGPLHSLAVLEDGTVRAWGSNGVGQLGDGTTTTRLTPVAVAELNEVDSAVSGEFHYAIGATGVCRSWRPRA